MRILLLGLIIFGAGRCCLGESGCFRSVGEAARAAGVRDEGGFRAEGVRRDPLSGLAWVRVVRCGRPEVPGVLVRGVTESVGSRPDKDETVVSVGPPGASMTRPLVVAGDAVRVVWEQGAARGELAGVAVVSGIAGARVRVRLQSLEKSAEERFVAGVVRAAGLVELETGTEFVR